MVIAVVDTKTVLLLGKIVRDRYHEIYNNKVFDQQNKDQLRSRSFQLSREIVPLIEACSCSQSFSQKVKLAIFLVVFG